MVSDVTQDTQGRGRNDNVVEEVRGHRRRGSHACFHRSMRRIFQFRRRVGQWWRGHAECLGLGANAQAGQRGVRKEVSEHQNQVEQHRNRRRYGHRSEQCHPSGIRHPGCRPTRIHDRAAVRHRRQPAFRSQRQDFRIQELLHPRHMELRECWRWSVRAADGFRPAGHVLQQSHLRQGGNLRSSEDLGRVLSGRQKDSCIGRRLLHHRGRRRFQGHERVPVAGRCRAVQVQRRERDHQLQVRSAGQDGGRILAEAH